MKEERMIEIFHDESIKVNIEEGDNAYKGLKILSKYTDQLITGASKDVIFSEDISKLIESGITEEECIELRSLNWMIEDDDYLACFV